MHAEDEESMGGIRASREFRWSATRMRDGIARAWSRPVLVSLLLSLATGRPLTLASFVRLTCVCPFDHDEVTQGPIHANGGHTSATCHLQNGLYS